RELAAADSSYWFGSAAYLGLSRILDPLFNALLKSPLIRSALPKPGVGSSAFLRGFDSKALDAQADMEEIAATIRASDRLRDLVLNTAPGQLQTALAPSPDGQAVLEGIDRYVAGYGHQIYNLDFVTPTLGEDFQLLHLSLKALVKQPPAQPVRARQAQMIAGRETLAEQTAKNLNPASERLFLFVWKWAKRYAPYREHIMFYMGAAWPTLRKLANELGQRLTAAGVIAEPDEIYYLESSEIEEAIANGSAPNYADRTQARRDLRESRKLLTPQPKVPLNSTLEVGPFKLTMFDPTPPNANGGAVLSGYAVSGGRVTAPASVIYSTADFDQMQPGSILVCTTTTPAWTPLFSQAVGLVTDVGGALAHGSIVAREYGIPAVMGTGVATERIQSGDMLMIDGDKGTVTLVDEQSEPGWQEVQEEPSRTKRRVVIAVAAAVAVVVGLILWRRRRR
ncbi:MAG: PEP-utilizing enzyme, partial [Chloroflexota bacterium]